ncbi:class I SAM-dependent methyltransferase [Blastopirellula retiformator]|uniref:Methyltransferase type 11 domain-containing protein n=1 Tax=Blastopirellula retiformator TaxID=2527970 RepID=A0A5C5V9M1_9BACT|nr:class I SAM-dependent methyltransferase [Blastopirellula retiformator]TWT34569.1 hypothetical protein Enr8_19800 [Blastopirellula retiformator]
MNSQSVAVSDSGKETLPRKIVSSHNWLVHKIIAENIRVFSRLYAKGRLVDIGCGRKPWLSFFEPYVDEYIGVDHAETLHDVNAADIVADAYNTTLPDEFADTVVSLAVLEHLEDPGGAITEMARLLKPSGYLILTAPMFWHEHEAPRDFFRYTQYGLKHLLESANLEVLQIKPLSGFYVTFIQEYCYILQPHSQRWGIGGLVKFLIYLLQRVAYACRHWDRKTGFAWMHLAVAMKPSSQECRGDEFLSEVAATNE